MSKITRYPLRPRIPGSTPDAKWKVQDLAHLQTCKIYHSCKHKMCKYQDIPYLSPPIARCKVQDIAHLHMCKIMYSCNYKCVSTETLFVHHSLHAMCKVQELAHLHIYKIVHTWRPYSFFTYYMRGIKVQDLSFNKVKDVENCHREIMETFRIH